MTRGKFIQFVTFNPTINQCFHFGNKPTTRR